MSQITYADIAQAIEAAGLVLRGAFHVAPDDAVPDVGCDKPAATLVLVGNAGPSMWVAFQAARAQRAMTLDEWSELVIGQLADRLQARALFPFAKPYLPFQAWAQKAEACFVSPIGMSIHPQYGLWHAYRGALAFPHALAIPQPDDAVSPCESCAEQPCLSTCPVEAFSAAGYDTTICASYLETSDDCDCLSLGCRARRSCPVGTQFTYEPAQARFHMEAFLRARQTL